jgi:hypothetical protein
MRQEQEGGGGTKEGKRENVMVPPVARLGINKSHRASVRFLLRLGGAGGRLGEPLRDWDLEAGQGCSRSNPPA